MRSYFNVYYGSWRALGAILPAIFDGKGLDALTGIDWDDPDGDPVGESNNLKDAGDRAGAAGTALSDATLGLWEDMDNDSDLDIYVENYSQAVLDDD